MSIVVAGYTGLVGSAIFEQIKNKGEDVIGVNSKVVDLLDRKATFEFICDLRPDVVIDAAAIVGGIGANSQNPVEFLSENLQIQSNLMDASNKAAVERFLFLGSSCIYPRDCKQPIKEEYLLTGPLERTNSAYAVAKIAGIELIKSYRRQYDRRWISVMPTNVYGPRDNFNIETGHVLPVLINKFVTATERGSSQVNLWGSGRAKREFIHSRDLAEATLFLLENYDSDLHINVGTGTDQEIRELANLIASKTGFRGNLNWDTTKPDGTPRKLLDVSRINELGWKPKVTLEEGVTETIEWFEKNESRLRS